MSVLTVVLASLAAFEHFYIFYLESLATHSASTSRVFNMDQEDLHRPSVTVLFKNQGIYNALIGVFLLYALFIARNSEIVTIFLLFIIGVAVYGAVTSNKKNYLDSGWTSNSRFSQPPSAWIRISSSRLGRVFHSYPWSCDEKGSIFSCQFAVKKKLCLLHSAFSFLEAFYKEWFRFPLYTVLIQ